MDRANSKDSTDSVERLPWVEVRAHPMLSFGCLVLICVLWLTMAVAASPVWTILPPGGLQGAQINVIVIQLLAVGLALWIGGLAVRRWQERRALERKIASMLSGESIPPQQIAQLAWRRTSRMAFTPESLEALEVSWKTQLPRLWIVRRAPPGRLARLLIRVSAQRVAPTTSRLKLASFDRRMSRRIAVVRSLAIVLLVSGVWVNMQHPVLGGLLVTLGCIPVFGIGILSDIPQWTILQTEGRLVLQRLRHWRWPWEAKPATSPTLELAPDRDVIVFMAPEHHAGQKEAIYWCRISLALRAVPRGTPTDFRGLIAEGSAAALVPVAAGPLTRHG